MKNLLSAIVAALAALSFVASASAVPATGDTSAAISEMENSGQTAKPAKKPAKKPVKKQKAHKKVHKPAKTEATSPGSTSAPATAPVSK